MNPPPETNDEAELRALLNRAAPPLLDDGFSQRVIAALPLPGPENDALLWRRFRFCLIGSAIGSACVVWSIISGLDAVGASQLGSDLLATATRLTEPRLALALVVAFGSLLYVFGPELKEKLFE